MSKHKFSKVRVPIEADNISIYRDNHLCIKCGKCKDICANLMGVASKYTLEDTLDEAVCIQCGQCAKNCPVGAIKVRPHWQSVMRAISDPTKVVVVSTAPSVRVTLGEYYDIQGNVQGKLVSALRALNFDYVLDTNFGADMTVMEEASELLDRLKKNKHLPMFTSCCPAWVKYVETFYPSLIPNLSTTKSPIAMMGTTIKSYFATLHGINPNNIVHVAIAPCSAKKYEASRSEMNDAGALYGNNSMLDTDYVLTVAELADWINNVGIDFANLPDGKYDTLMSEYSGGGAIFGTTGGVMQSTLRTAYRLKYGKDSVRLLGKLNALRAPGEIRELIVPFGDTTLSVAVVYGTRNADRLIKEVLAGIKMYDMVEVMACPGGCIGGAGVKVDKNNTLSARSQLLYDIDNTKDIKCSVDNPEISKVYHEYYISPLSPKSDDMLHTIYTNRSEILSRSKYNK